MTPQDRRDSLARFSRDFGSALIRCAEHLPDEDVAKCSAVYLGRASDAMREAMRASYERRLDADHLIKIALEAMLTAWRLG